MKKKTLKISVAIFLLLIISFINTKMVILGYRDEPGDFGIESAQRYSAMCVYVLIPVFCENYGRDRNGPGYYLTNKRVYSYWMYLIKGDEIFSQEKYFNQTFYCYDKDKKRKKVDKENYGIPCSKEYREVFQQ